MPQLGPRAGVVAAAAALSAGASALTLRRGRPSSARMPRGQRGIGTARTPRQKAGTPRASAHTSTPRQAAPSATSRRHREGEGSDGGAAVGGAPRTPRFPRPPSSASSSDNAVRPAAPSRWRARGKAPKPEESEVKIVQPTIEEERALMLRITGRRVNPTPPC